MGLKSTPPDTIGDLRGPTGFAPILSADSLIESLNLNGRAVWD